jgi:uncharacterized protein YjbI with pentapeptide repeats
MTVDEAITIAETALNYDRLNKVQEIVFRQSWEGRSYMEIAKSAGYEYDYIKDAGAKLWKLLSKALEEKVKKDNLKSVLKRYLRRSQVNLQRNLTIEVNLSGANLSGANLSGARLFANLNEADYVQTDLDKIITSDSETELSDSENEIDWNGFCFHSDAQVKIAEILDRTSTLFIPNSQLRLAREHPDFAKSKHIKLQIHHSSMHNAVVTFEKHFQISTARLKFLVFYLSA